MSDRWNPRTVTVPTYHPPKFFVPGDVPAGGAVEPRGKTWGIRERGDLGSTVVHAYRCPVHGLFDVRVPRSDVPDEVFCAVHDEHETMWNACGRTSPWAGSFCGQGIASGEVES